MSAELPGSADRARRASWASLHARERWILGHAAFVAVTAVLVRLPNGPPWPFTAPANVLHLLALPAPFLLVACAVTRRWLAALAEVLAAALAVAALWPPWGFGGSELEPAPIGGFGSSESRGGLRVATLNLGAGLAEPSDVIEFVRAHDIEVLVLLELTRGIAARLSAELGGSHPHRALHPGGIDGKGLLSKHAILAEELFVLEQGRSYLRCALLVDGREVELVAVHCAPSIAFLGRSCAAGRDLEALGASLDAKQATLLLGDFNTTERSGSCARLRALGLRDAFRAGGGAGFTFPVFGRYFGLPVGRFLRIDHVWHGAGLVPLGARTGPDVGSDHLPVSVDFAFVDPATGTR